MIEHWLLQTLIDKIANDRRNQIQLTDEESEAFLALYERHGECLLWLGSPSHLCPGDADNAQPADAGDASLRRSA